MDNTIATLIVALVVVAVAAVLLWRSQSRDSPARASFTFGELFSAEVELGTQQEARADKAVRAAEQQRGTPTDASLQRLRNEDSVTLARILWVDDHPDNNLYETIAFENLGRFITVATSTEAALTYLRELEFAVAITDVAREDDVSAGETFIQQARANGYHLPIVVYTSDAAAGRSRLIAVGAQAVADLPGDLVREVDHLIRGRAVGTSAT
jgi:CheY-like chemotaxis protein